MNKIASRFKIFNSEHLKIIGMICMLCDHLGATLLPWIDALGLVGRIAFPIFAFQISEGFYNTHNYKKYLKRMFIFAIISEIPFDMMYYGWPPFYPFHQNVLWTFCLSLLVIKVIDISKKFNIAVRALITAVVSVLGAAAALITMTDYYAAGVLTVVVFYLTKNIKIGWILQILALWLINIELLGGEYRTIELFGHNFEIVIQGIALLALPIIWMYNGRQGKHSKTISKICYWFYPIHLLIVSGIWLIVN
ncbi:MAG: conjugal transfer protein TraX [Clostridiales bacterium]|nr:conjugal transfer protein TraX [Clostridiales bacterium]